MKWQHLVRLKDIYIFIYNTCALITFTVLNSRQVDFSFSVKPLEAFNPDTNNLENCVSTQNHNKFFYEH